MNIYNRFQRYDGKKSFEETSVTRLIDSHFLKKRKNTFLIPKPSQPVVLLLSGGIDSMCLWNLLLVKYGLEVFPLYFTREKEKSVILEQTIQEYSQILKKRHPFLFHKPHKIIFNTNITSFDEKKGAQAQPVDLLNVVQNLVYDSFSKIYHLNQIGNPTRMGYMAFGAFEFCTKLEKEKGIKIRTIISGIVPEDGRVTQEGTLSTLRSVNLMMCQTTGDYSWQFTAPIEKKNNFYYTKRQLLQLAIDADLPIGKTWTCNVFDQKYHCGKCIGCMMRQQILRELHIKDYAVYRDAYTLKEKKLPSLKRIVMKILSHLRSVPVFSNEDLLSISPSIKTYKRGQLIVLYNTKNNTIEIVNEVGSYIWKLVSKNDMSLNQILLHCSHQYKLNRQREKEIEDFIKEYISLGYLIIKK